VGWSFVYLGLCRLFQLVALLCRSERSKELEILLLRHELAILRRQPRRAPVRPVDRAFLAALTRALPRSAWSGLSVRPATVLRGHRQLVRRRWTYPHRRPPGRPPLDRRNQALTLRLARENPSWGYRRIVGELRGPGISVSTTSVRTILIRHGLPPAPQRDELSWRNFLRQHAATTLVCDFFTVETAWLKRLYVLFLSLERRRVEFVGCTPSPTGAWTAQQARNLLMTLDEQEQPLRRLVHDRDAKFSGGFDHVFESEGIAVIRTPVQAPNANAHAERCVGSVRRECLDRLLIFSRRQLEQVLRVYARHYNRHRPHCSLAFRPPNRQTEARHLCEHHPIRSSIAVTYSAG
jgi:hypothetical protein